MLRSLSSAPLIQVTTWEESRAASSGTHLSSGPSAFTDSVASHQMKGEWDQHACVCVHAFTAPNTYTQTHYNCVGQKTKSCSILGEDDAQRRSMEEAEQGHTGTV